MNNIKDAQPVSKRIYGPPEYVTFSHSTCYNDELPLDMSMKRRSPSHYLAGSSSTIDNKLGYALPSSTCSSPLREHLTIQSKSACNIYDKADVVRERPSVITCASSGNKNEYSSFEEMKSLPPPPSYTTATNRYRENYLPTVSDTPASLEMKRIPSAFSNSIPSIEQSTENSDYISLKRQLVKVSSVDPEIDEHFRRSLGTTNYQQLFVSPSLTEDSVSNESVDDHFTKALGETWRKLKARKITSELEDKMSRFGHNRLYKI